MKNVIDNKRVRVIRTVLLVLVFSAQSLSALALPCAMMAGQPDEVSGLGSDPHAGHAMDMTQSAHEGGGCCEDASFCSMANCLASPAAVSLSIESVIGRPALPGTFFPAVSIESVPELLFRPPISG